MGIIARETTTAKTPRVLFDGTRPHRAPFTFGRGVLASRPHQRRDHTARDEAWVAAFFNQWADEVIDEQRALEWEEMDRLERGVRLF